MPRWAVVLPLPMLGHWFAKSEGHHKVEGVRQVVGLPPTHAGLLFTNQGPS